RDVTLRGWRKVDGILFARLGFTTKSVWVSAGPMLQIDKLAPDGPAAGIGLQAGDVIDAVRPAADAPRQAWTLSRPEGLAVLVLQLAAKSVLDIDVLRDEDNDRRLEQGELFKGRLILR
ncbi:MAG: hypothetical protein ABIP42_12280, partial [Planctomycetota bacterium]